MFIGIANAIKTPQFLSIYQKVASLFLGNQNGALQDYSQLTQQYQDSAGSTPVTAVEQPLGLVLDGKTGYTRGAELKANGAVGLVGAATVATYNTGTGAGSVTSVDVGNQSFVQWSGLNTSAYAVTITLNSGVAVMLRSGSQSGTVTYQAISVGVPVTVFVPASVGLITITSNSGTATFTVNSFKEVAGNHLTQATSAARPIVSARVNLCTESEFRNGITDAPIRGGLVSATSFTGYAGAIAFGHDGATSSYAYKNPFTTTIGVTYSLSVIVKMTDTLIPVFGSATAASALNDFVLVVAGDATNSTLNVITSLGNGLYRISTSYTAVAASSNFGVVKYSTNSSRTFVVTAYQVGIGSVTTTYQSITTATSYNTVGFPTYAKFDGVDDSLSSTTGGGATSGFFWCGAVKPLGGAGTERHIWSDQSGNNGYIVAIDTANRLRLYAGNGTSFTGISTVSTANIGTTYLFIAWDDGTNLNVQIDNGAVASVARPTVAAGTTSFTVGKFNGAASNFVNGNIYPSIYRTGTPLTAAERAAAQAWCKSKAGL